MCAASRRGGGSHALARRRGRHGDVRARDVRRRPAGEVLAELRVARRCGDRGGVDRDRIVVDPGDRIREARRHSLAVLGQLERLARAGLSRARRRVAQAIHRRNHGSRRPPPIGLREPSAASVSALERGARLFRVHDVSRHAGARRRVGDHARQAMHEYFRTAPAAASRVARHSSRSRRQRSRSIACCLLFHRTRAMQVLVGIIVLAIAYGVAYLLHLAMIVYLLSLSSATARSRCSSCSRRNCAPRWRISARSPMSRLFRQMEEAEVGDEVAEAVERLSRSGIGAIIAIEREVSLDEYVQSGSEMEAKVSADLLATIFTPVLAAARRRRDHSRRHDHRGGMHSSAVADARSIDRSLGTRHRAALGLSEETRRARGRRVRGDRDDHRRGRTGSSGAISRRQQVRDHGRRPTVEAQVSPDSWARRSRS